MGEGSALSVMAGRVSTACTDLRNDRENRVISRHWSSSPDSELENQPVDNSSVLPTGQNILEMCARGRACPGHPRTGGCTASAAVPPIGGGWPGHGLPRAQICGMIE